VFGPDLKKWQWGQAHQTIPFHPFSAVKMLRPVFSRQALPTPGDFYTPFQAAFSLEPRLDWPRSVLFMPSYRQILNLGNPKESVAIHLTGQAGHPLSHRYDNLLAPYQEGKYFALGPGMQTARGFEMLPKSPSKDQ
jgi:penicillin amidase